MVVFITAVTLLLAWCLLIYFLGKLPANGSSQSRLPVVQISGDLIKVRWHGETIESTVEDCSLCQLSRCHPLIC